MLNLHLNKLYCFKKIILFCCRKFFMLQCYHPSNGLYHNYHITISKELQAL